MKCVPLHKYRAKVPQTRARCRGQSPTEVESQLPHTKNTLQYNIAIIYYKPCSKQTKYKSLVSIA